MADIPNITDIPTLPDVGAVASVPAVPTLADIPGIPKIPRVPRLDPRLRMAASLLHKRTYAAAHFSLELDGKKDVGLFKSIEGGGIKAEVMTYQQGANYDHWRTLGKPKFEDVKAQVGMAMSEPFCTWIEHFVKGVPDRRNGAILAADFTYSERARREFTNAMITELTFPKLDATDTAGTPAYMNVAFSVESIVFKEVGMLGGMAAAVKGVGNKVLQSFGMDLQKLWTTNNFKFRLDGFEKACKRTARIDSFTIKQKVLEYHQGGYRAPTKTPSQIEFPMLSVYVPEADADPFFKRFSDRAHTYKTTPRGPLDQKSGMIEAFDAENRTLLTVEFYEAEIYSVQPDKAGSDEIKMVKIDIFLERMKFTYSPWWKSFMPSIKGIAGDSIPTL